MTKLRIDLFSGTLEVDGEEGFVRSVYDDFKDQLLKVRGGTAAQTGLNVPATTSETAAPEETPSVKPPKPVRVGSRSRGAAGLALSKDLDLSATANDLDLGDFYAAKSPQSAMERNAVFVYYLQRIAGISRITINHVYTCYKYVNVKYPNALKQSLADTSSRKNWLNTSSFDDIQLSAAGENYVEHDLPGR